MAAETRRHLQICSQPARFPRGANHLTFSYASCKQATGMPLTFILSETVCLLLSLSSLVSPGIFFQKLNASREQLTTTNINHFVHWSSKEFMSYFWLLCTYKDKYILILFQKLYIQIQVCRDQNSSTYLLVNYRYFSQYSALKICGVS